MQLSGRGEELKLENKYVQRTIPNRTQKYIPY
jgi:hypothetical protein